MQNTKTIRNIIIVLILIVVGAGVFFGYTFYQASKGTGVSGGNNTNPTRTSFQTRTASGSDITIVDTENPTETQNPSTSFTPMEDVSKLVQLSKQPVSGFDFFAKDIQVLATTTKGTTTVVTTKTLKNQIFGYFWDRSTGNVFENLASSSEIIRVSNYTSPAAQEVYFVTPTTVVVRELTADNENIVTFFVNLLKESATSTLFTATKKRLLIDTDHISVSPETKKMLYTLKNTGQAYVSNIDSSSILNILTTNITQWVPQYVNRTTLSLTTKPSAYYPGYLFFVNSAGTQDNQYILGDKYGFTTLTSPDGNKVLYSEIESDLLQTSIYDIKTKKTVRLSQATLTEKCVWSNDSKKVYCAIPQTLDTLPYPDVWYQGLTEFSDNIWSVDPSTGVFELEIALQDDTKTNIDAYNLKISSDRKHFLFQDKYTLALWKYNF